MKLYPTIFKQARNKNYYILSPDKQVFKPFVVNQNLLMDEVGLGKTKIT